MDMKRQQRKYDHLAHAVELEQGPLKSGWDDINFIHQGLYRYDFKEMDTSVVLFGKRLEMPLIINALTGGAQGLEKINGSLALAARETGIGIAVGSQTAGLKNNQLRETYEVVRKVYSDGLILANVSALVKPTQALAAVEMIEADALQLHLNGVQELIMYEGDRDFSSMMENIHSIVEASPVPVVIKEVGFGISRETALELYQLGVSAIDCGGAGGTNFASIELSRFPQGNLDFLRYWGIPAAASLIEVQQLGLPVPLIASGGIISGLDICKALAIGAQAAAVAGPFLKILLKQNEEALIQTLNEIREQINIIMISVGIKKVSEFSTVPLIIDDTIRNWCLQRGIETNQYGRREFKL